MTHPGGGVDVPVASSGGMSDSPVLTVSDLTVEFDTEVGTAVVVQGVDFVLQRGQILGLVGESGSGKSVTSLAMLGLIRSPPGRVTSGEVRFEGRDLLTLPAAEMRDVRGKELALIFQEPRRSLDPSFSVGYQIAEVARRHLGLSRREAWARAVESLDMVQIPESARRAREYPHTFSGGMCQRVMLAMALVCRPKVLIADEPTTALDVTVQAQMLDLLRELQGELGLAILLITHDLGVVAGACERVAVMYAGQIVETAPVREIFRNPQHPYTAGLLASLPQNHVGSGELGAIPGVVPSPHAWPEGCRFHPRCSHALDICRGDEAPLLQVAPDHQVRCVRSEALVLRGIE